jgi:uncharacterized membrane protein
MNKTKLLNSTVKITVFAVESLINPLYPLKIRLNFTPFLTKKPLQTPLFRKNNLCFTFYCS